MSTYLHDLDRDRLPTHVGIVMDGNGRWAKLRGLPRIDGHAAGERAMWDTVVGADALGLKWLTMFAFSSENWNRPKAEVDALMDLLVKTVIQELQELHENEVRLDAIGDLESLPDDCRKILKDAIKRTAGNSRITLTLALSYSARWELTNMARSIAEEARAGRLDPAAIDERTVADHLSTRGIPDPELLIRTSGEQRISNFLLWQIAYAELWFTPVLWPDFRKEHLYQAVLDFQNRERRFGLISEQVS